MATNGELTPGMRVQATKDHGGVKTGEMGVVVSAEQGPYYAVSWPGVSDSCGYCPADCVETTADVPAEKPAVPPPPSTAVLDFEDIALMKGRRR